MNVLVLSPYPERIADTLKRYGDRICATSEPFSEGYADEFGWLIAFGYRHILTQDQLAPFGNRAINIHISALPWNRGADPNFWSWFDDTLKGCTIHRIAEGIDTGDILAQTILPIPNGHTLASSYDVLMREAVALFDWHWPAIREGKIKGIPQGPGTYHRQADKEPWMKKLGFGWNTPCAAVERLGKVSRAAERVFDID